MQAEQTLGEYKVRMMIDVPVLRDSLPLVIMQHGIGERSDTNLALVMRYGPLKQVKDGVALPFPFIGVQPQLSKTRSKWEVGITNEVIDHMIARYPVDESRIYLMGVSLGGWGVWEVLTDPKSNHRIAAAVIICGGTGPRGKEAEIVKARIPLWTAHAKNDDIVPYSVTANAVQKINELAGREQARFSRQGLGGHSIWNKIFDPDHGVYDWLKFQKLGAELDKSKFDAAIAILDDTVQKLTNLKTL